MIADLSAMRATAEAYDLGLEIATRSGILGTYKMQQVPEAVSALENIEELLNSIRAYTDEQRQIAASEEGEGETGTSHVTIDEWLQNIALLTDMDNEKSEDRDRVTLMTVHGAKGLEFEHVYVAGLEEDLFPSMMSLGTPEGLEEERRLFYVALTRAKRSAVLSFAESRFKWGKMDPRHPSRFLSEIDPKYLDLQFDLGEGGQNEDATPQRQARTRFAERGRNAETQRGEYGRRPGGYGQRPDAYGVETRTYYPPKTQERPTPRPGTDAGRALPQHGQPSGRRNRRSGACGSRAVRRRLCRGDARRACQVRRRHGHGRRRVVGRPEDHRRVRRRGTQDAAAQVRQADGAEKISAARHFGTGGKREPGNEAEPSVSPPDAPRLPRQVRNKAGYHR